MEFIYSCAVNTVRSALSAALPQLPPILHNQGRWRMVQEGGHELHGSRRWSRVNHPSLPLGVFPEVLLVEGRVELGEIVGEEAATH